MKSIHIQDETSPFFAEALEVYRASFPPNERRTLAGQTQLFHSPKYRLDAWVGKQHFIGIMAWWDFDEYRYVEHLAVHPDSRSGGYGAKLMHDWLSWDERPVYLEIEEPVDELTKRRRGFYQRLGFVQNPGRHLQPPYDGKGDGVPMVVLSRPGAISQAQHESLLTNLHTQVWVDISK